MRKIFSSVLSFVFLFNSFIPAFAANCNYEGMLKSSSNPSWLFPECLIGFTCKYMNNDENRAKNRKIGHNGYNAYLAKMDKILHSTGNNAEQDKFLNAANVFVAAYGINNEKKVLLKSGEWVLRPVSKEDIERAINIVNQACSKNGEDKFIDALNQEKQRADSGQRKAFIPDLKYINAEIMYPSVATVGEPCKDMKEFEALLKNKIKAVYDQGKHCRESGDCDFDIHKVVRAMVAKSNSKKCDDKFYLTNQNLRYLFLVYAALINNTPEDINKLLNYISYTNGDYPERVQAAAANAAMAFSKYTLNVNEGVKKLNTMPGTFDYNTQQREIIAAGVSLEYMRAGMSDVGYKLYKQNIDRVIEGYDKNEIFTLDANGTVIQHAEMPTAVSILMLGTFSSIGTTALLSEGISIEAIGSSLIVKNISMAKKAASGFFAKARTLSLARPGVLVIESSALGTLLAGLSIPAVTIFELNNAFAGSYLRAKKDSVNKYMAQLIDSATTKNVEEFPVNDEIDEYTLNAVAVTWEKNWAKYGEKATDATKVKPATCNQTPQQGGPCEDITLRGNGGADVRLPYGYAAKFRKYVKEDLKLSLKTTTIEELLNYNNLDEVYKEMLDVIKNNCNKYSNSKNPGGKDSAFVKAFKKDNRYIPEAEINVDLKPNNIALKNVFSSDILNTICGDEEFLSGKKKEIDLGNGRSLRNTDHEIKNNHVHYEELRNNYLCNHSIQFDGTAGSFLDQMNALCNPQN